jgi:hypothetical protein
MDHDLGVPYQRFANTWLQIKKVTHKLFYTSIGIVQINIHKCNTWWKKFGNESKHDRKLTHIFAWG